MDTRFQHIFLIIVMGMTSSIRAEEAAVDNADVESVQQESPAGSKVADEIEKKATDSERAIYEPTVSRQDFKEDAIDTENLEVGVKYGILSIEDFEVNATLLASINYYVLEDMFVSLNYGTSTAGDTSYELLSGGAQILLEEDRDYTYYNISLGYNLFPGEVFLGSKRAFNSALYLLAGAGITDFASDEFFTFNFGFGFSFIATDWLAIQIQMQDYIMETSILGEEKLSNNFELTMGLSVFF